VGRLGEVRALGHTYEGHRYMYIFQSPFAILFLGAGEKGNPLTYLFVKTLAHDPADSQGSPYAYLFI